MIKTNKHYIQNYTEEIENLKASKIDLEQRAKAIENATSKTKTIERNRLQQRIKNINNYILIIEKSLKIVKTS